MCRDQNHLQVPFLDDDDDVHYVHTQLLPSATERSTFYQEKMLVLNNLSWFFSTIFSPFLTSPSIGKLDAAREIKDVVQICVHMSFKIG